MKKKFKIKSLELAIDMLVAVIAEMTVEKAFSKIPVPDYKQNSTGEKITCIENDFQKGMLEADKELQNVCKNCKTRQVPMRDTSYKSSM